jgi:uncharacterized membrane protein
MKPFIGMVVFYQALGQCIAARVGRALGAVKGALNRLHWENPWKQKNVVLRIEIAALIIAVTLLVKFTALSNEISKLLQEALELVANNFFPLP